MSTSHAILRRASPWSDNADPDRGFAALAVAGPAGVEEAAVADRHALRSDAGPRVDRALSPIRITGFPGAGEPVFRLGGEEFLALLQSADRQAAGRAAERILQALRDDALHLPDARTLILRASLGMAEVGSRESMAAAIGRADDALYAAKAAGRDTWRWAQAAR
jgi:predicted signal transduction protein with EAL and GGDEF domain